MSKEVIKPLTTSDNKLAPTLKKSGQKLYVKFDGSCLKQDKITFNHGRIVNIHNVYDLKSPGNYDDNITFEICLLGAVKLTKNVDISK